MIELGEWHVTVHLLDDLAERDAVGLSAAPYLVGRVGGRSRAAEVFRDGMAVPT